MWEVIKIQGGCSKYIILLRMNNAQMKYYYILVIHK